MDSKHIIAKRVAAEFKDGDVVNLGIGIPCLIPDYTDKEVVFQCDNGILGISSVGGDDEYTCNPAGQTVSLTDYGCYFDSVTGFDMIGGGHIDYTVLGALQVDEEGNLANWMIPGKLVPGMGGAMDLACGSKNVIIAMEHTSKGNIKIVKKCTLPLTAPKCVKTIVTELCVIEVTEKGLLLKEIREGISVNEVLEKTDADLIIPEKIGFFS